MVESKKQIGKVGFDLETGFYWGEVLHLCGIDTFHAESIDELRRLLRKSMPEQQGESDAASILVEKVVLDLNPTLFYKLNQQAMLHGRALNQYIVDILKEIVDESQFLEPV